jgi:membrane associated rhomboid family serine protease
LISSALILGILTNICTLLTYDPHVHLLGASGAVYALAALWQTLYFVFEKNRSAREKFWRCIGFTAIVLFPNTFEITVSYEAHAFGFLLGMCEGLLVVPLLSRKLNLSRNMSSSDP